MEEISKFIKDKPLQTLGLGMAGFAFGNLFYKLFQSSVGSKQTKSLGVVITGSTKGIGFNFAKEFIRLGHRVVICSRSLENTKVAAEKINSSNLFYTTCDITKPSDVDELVKFSSEKLVDIDLWINNAGYAILQDFISVETKELVKIVTSNIIGTIYCCKVVLPVMLKQKNGGHIFVFEGFGSNGMKMKGFTTYGTTRYALRYFGQSLANEMVNTNVGIHRISPGLVLTEAVFNGKEKVPKEITRLMNVIGDQAENVAKHLVPKIASVQGNDKIFQHRSPFTYIFRYMTSWLYQWENLVTKDGEPLVKFE